MKFSSYDSDLLFSQFERNTITKEELQAIEMKLPNIEILNKQRRINIPNLSPCLQIRLKEYFRKAI